MAAVLGYLVARILYTDYMYACNKLRSLASSYNLKDLTDWTSYLSEVSTTIQSADTGITIAYVSIRLRRPI